MEIFFSDTARGGKKRKFVPLDEKKIRIYSCGPTVYDQIHIGNARPHVVFDVLVRFLRHNYGQECVRYVRNITDIDDKIVKRARQQKQDINELTAETIADMKKDDAFLKCLQPDEEPRATDHIKHMVAMIEKLLRAGHAYQVDQHVLFDVGSFPEYGMFARRALAEQTEGARVEIAPYKRNPRDFVLWKPPASEDEPQWDSPFGKGRPGWHIECAAMSVHYLGPEFDIHCGGQDLVFPHHENEISQVKCAFEGSAFARYWLHNGYILANGVKMSKSAGNFHTVASLRPQWPGEALRLCLLGRHYRRPLNFSFSRLDEAVNVLDNFYRVLDSSAAGSAEKDENTEPDAQILEALADDLNTPKALSRLHKIKIPNVLKASARLLGLLQESPHSWFHRQDHRMQNDAIEKLIAERTQARKSKDFRRADEIRSLLERNGVLIEDRPGEQTSWRRSA